MVSGLCCGQALWFYFTTDTEENEVPALQGTFISFFFWPIDFSVVEKQKLPRIQLSFLFYEEENLLKLPEKQ